MKQIPVSEHVTPQHHAETIRNARRSVLESHFGHLVTTCKFCGLPTHSQYVCSCGVDTGYLEDENGAAVHPLVEVFEVPA